ncbi:MAG: hypothetical protein CVV21_07005 [Candidatus Goldiibacteriota bacterium HGW-Goldbacteria-1]|jgi:hypothetical protein|nr:MAG: hypothetical protein CVV21_07005 [Candidatus Goldiibacteriota bacterium HGW-Goldbacteria-1]
MDLLNNNFLTKLKHREKKGNLIFLALLMLVFTTSCGLNNVKKTIYSASELPSDKVLVVGRVLFDPPMTEESQSLEGQEIYRYLMMFVCDEKLTPLKEENEIFSRLAKHYRIEGYLDDTFYAVSEPEAFYIEAGVMYKNIYTSSCGYKCTQINYEYLSFPGSFHINIKPGDRAVYIGTIIYQRDNFYNVKRIIIRDDYDKEMPKFRRYFGNMKLRKALIREPAEDAILKIGAPY